MLMWHLFEFLGGDNSFVEGGGSNGQRKVGGKRKNSSILISDIYLVSASSAEDPESNKLMYILVPSITIPLALAMLLAIVCFCQRTRSRSTASRHPSTNGKSSQPVELSPLNPKTSSRAKEFAPQNVRYLQELGEGAFGKVYK